MDSESSDSVLARRAASGDDQAFEVLVRRHKEPLYRLLRRYTGNPDDAYEAVQEAFIAAWRAIGRYDPGRPFSFWLRAIAINKARDQGRRLAVRRLILGASGLDGKAMSIPDREPPIDEAVIGRQRAERLDAAIRRLPSSLRAPLVLTAFEGHSHRDAGLILGLSVKTVEMRVHRARKILAARLDDDMRPSSHERRVAPAPALIDRPRAPRP